MSAGSAGRRVGGWLPPWLMWLLLAVTTLGAALLGAADVALRTDAGRRVVVRVAVGAANNALDGRITVGSFEGSIRHGLEARDVTIEGRDGVEMARIPALSLRYRLRDLVRGRIVLGQLTLSRPRVSLVQAPSGRLNAEDILGLGKPGGGKGRKPLVAFSDVEINDATLLVRTIAPSGARVPELEPGPHGHYRVRRFEGINARLPYLRLASPLEGERSIRIVIADLRAKLSDPALDIRGAEGTVDIDGDSARLDLSRAVLPGSRAKVKGTLSWHGRALSYHLAIDANHTAVDDLRGMAPGLPPGLEAVGEFAVRTHKDNAFELQSDWITVTGTGGGGSFTGRLGLVLGPGAAWAAKTTNVTLDNFDLEYVRPILDTLPIAGRLSGALKADGPRERLAVEVDWVFRDSLVAGRPESRARARGEVALGVPGGFAFRGLSIQEARIDLGTVRRILPAIALRGVIGASGTVNGPWLEPEFSGMLRHRDAPLPPSVARGVVRLDARGDTIGVWANLAWDSLRLDGFHSSYPGFPVSGSFGGEIQLAGYADSLGLSGDLAGPSGRLVGGGALTLVSPHYGVRGLDLALRGLSLDGLHARLPPSQLFGRIAGLVDTDTLLPPVVRIAVTLDSSLAAGSRLDSLRATIGAADSAIRFERFDAWAPGVRMTGRGGLGLGATSVDSLTFTVEADPLRDAEPFVRWLLNLAPDTTQGGPVGAVRVRGSLAGRLDDFRLSGEAALPRLEWGGLALARTRARGEWRSTARGVVGLTWLADSATFGGFTVSQLDLAVAGRRDSLGWRLSARMRDSARVVAAGRAHQDTLALALPIDSLRLALPVLSWHADTGALLVLTDSALSFHQVTLLSDDGGARLAVDGTLPLTGAGNLRVMLEQLPVTDLLAAVQRGTGAIGGNLSGTFDLTGTAAEPVMAGAFSVVDGRFGEFRVPQMDGSLNYAARRLKGTFALRRLGERLLDLELELPLDLALSPVPERRLDGPVSIRGVADSVDLAIVEALTPQVRRASGRFDADVGISGTWARPELAGAVTITGGGLSLPSVGARYERMDGRLSLFGDTIRVDSLRLESVPLAGKAQRGSLQVDGYVRLEQLARPVMALRLTAGEFQLMDVRNFLSAAVTGELDLAGPVVGATLTGQGTMTRGVLYFADLVTKQVVNLQDTLFRDLLEDTLLVRRQGLGPAFHNVFWDSLRIENLGIEVGSDVWLRSNEANIQLAGTVSLRKLATAYRLDGTLTAPRGSYRLSVPPLLSREFAVTRGEVQYFDTPDLNAGLDIEAQYVVKRRSEDNVTVSVHIGGTLYLPKLTFSSDVRPPLSDVEIISLLLVGSQRGVDPKAGEFVLSQLPLVSEMVGQFEALASNLGLPIQYFDIRPGEVASGLNGTQIAVGFQVGPSVFVTLSPRFCKAAAGQLVSPGDNLGASLEFRLTREWRAAASFDPIGTCGSTGARSANVGRQAGVDLFWEKRF